MSTRQAMPLFLGMMLLLLSPCSALGHLHPAICVTKKGTLVVVHYYEANAKVLICRSADGGNSWSESVPVAGVKPGGTYPGALTTLSDGRIVVTWNWFPKGKTSPRETQFAVSSDEGQTWSQPRSLPLKDGQSTSERPFLRHALLELSANEWVFPRSNQTVVFDVQSGKATPFGDGHNHGGVPIVRTAKGTLISGAGRRSTDQGKTWQQIKPFPAMDYGSDMIALTNGYVVAARDINDKRGIQFIVSRDDGATWDLDGALDIYKPGGRPDTQHFGRPHLAQIDPDTLGVVFWDHGTAPEGSGATLVAVGERGTKVYFLRVPLTKLQARGK